jgi:aspartate/glutamate racemase
MTVRIALIHALAHSVAPINLALSAQWPQAQVMNLLDDSLSADLARSAAGLDAAMAQRFMTLADYAVATGAQGILFTCSAFGPCIDAVATRHAPMPVLKPNEAMVADAVAMGLPLGLVASFAPTLRSMPPEFPKGTLCAGELADGALDALNAGDTGLHDRLVVEAALRAQASGAKVIALAQFSMARAEALVAQHTGLPVLTTVSSAVAALRRRLVQAA